MLWKLCSKRHSSKYQTSLKKCMKGFRPQQRSALRVHFSSWYVKDLSFLSHMFFFFLTNSVFFKLLKTVRQEIKWSDVFSSPDKNNLIVMSGNQNNVLVLVKTHRALDTYTHTHTRRLGLLPALIKAAFNTFRAGSDSVGVSRLQTSTSSTWPFVYRQRPVKSSL